MFFIALNCFQFKHESYRLKHLVFDVHDCNIQSCKLMCLLSVHLSDCSISKASMNLNQNHFQATLCSGYLNFVAFL